MDHFGHETIVCEVEGQLWHHQQHRLMQTVMEFRADGCVTWRER